MHSIARLAPTVGESDIRVLAELLVNVVQSGEAVSFLAPLALEQAEQWWRQSLANADARAVFLVARRLDEGTRCGSNDGASASGSIVGTVQLHPAWAPNQPHRAEIAKLLVDARSRRMGLGRRLMETAEDAARDAGFTMLTLDAKRGGAAESLYRSMGWIHAGTIPRFALDPDGVNYHDAVIMYKELPQRDE